MSRLREPSITSSMADPHLGPRHPLILEEEVSDELVLYDPEGKIFVGLNQTAADVWRLLTGKFTLDEIVTKIADSYGVSSESIREQVENTIRDLAKAGMLSGEYP